MNAVTSVTKNYQLSTPNPVNVATAANNVQWMPKSVRLAFWAMYALNVAKSKSHPLRPLLKPLTIHKRPLSGQTQGAKMSTAYHVIQFEKVVAVVDVNRADVIVTMHRNKKLSYHAAERLTAMKRARMHRDVRFSQPFNVEVAWF